MTVESTAGQGKRTKESNTESRNEMMQDDSMEDVFLDTEHGRDTSIEIDHPSRSVTDHSGWFPANPSPNLVAIFEEDEDFNSAKHETQMWSSRLTYLIASVGGAVGIGNVWRFPFLCYRNGGATFLIPYFLSLFALGIPLWILESSLGQGIGKSSLGCFRDLSRRWKGLGWLSFVANQGICIYYCVVLAWSLRYLGAGMSAGPIPWAGGSGTEYFQSEILHNAYVCWQRNGTVDWSKVGEARSWHEEVYPLSLLVNQSRLHQTDILDYTQADEMRRRFGLRCHETGFHQQGRIIDENVTSLLVIWLVVLVMVFYGTKTLKWSVYLSIPLPYIVLVVIFFRGVTLEGASDGIRFYLQPDMERLFYDRVNPETGEVQTAIDVWINAASHIFFTFGLAEGILITYASYNPPHFHIPSNAAVIAFTNCATEFFSGFCVFSILGYMAHKKGVAVEDVVAGSPSLVFETIPEALSLMPSPKVFNSLFFIMLLLLGITSATTIVEVSVSILRDQCREMIQRGGACSGLGRLIMKKTWFLPCIVSVLSFLLGLLFCRRSGSLWVDLVDGSISNFLLTLIGFCEFVLVAWIFGMPNVRLLLHRRIAWFPKSLLGFLWKYVGPVTTFVLLVAGVR
ncbi:hypothetical protein GUITHDRAFT_112949 [Guillardia theta CCMP2712]|uniref:Transporter n=1 Tax=Guillardia theta (strain CCMP2712) TaxID=905079 RepID=L1IYG8_GUITC|nr:hypothetical protein GUITHDRAFT_112949 [Guillardia theta CCMP2712]EKX40944.1 hypothetical protein GUITHDRAFT_112949 [Guillardia theta CCMP2712]|eukprot:XP_005827924.1 hypothetical protein GUITHDRAFT_112949 [Guillardia theta CCMP2712]